MHQLVLHYDGGGFSGWQRQADVRTVQGELEAALADEEDASDEAAELALDEMTPADCAGGPEVTFLLPFFGTLYMTG